jgi:hypothetical protein
MTPATELADIFAQLVKNRESDVGIEELYSFQQRHPDHSIEKCLNSVSVAFKNDTLRRLKEVADKHRSFSAVSSSPDSSSSILSMAAIRARLASSSSSSSSPAAPVAPSASSETLPSAPVSSSTAAAATTKQPLDLASLRARLNEMKH